jgi:hypothetical protein
MSIEDPEQKIFLSGKKPLAHKNCLSAACNHKRALETHIRNAKPAGVSAGFPIFMNAHAVFKPLSDKLHT